VSPSAYRVITGTSLRVCPSSSQLRVLKSLSSSKGNSANGGQSADDLGSNKDDDEEEMDEEDSEDVCIVHLQYTGIHLTCKLLRTLKSSQTAPYNLSLDLL
jgi:hypothetical protein